jgi:2-oxoglutarate/2-oxoacid ferredoxin oxidoreductase subunit beta
MSDELNTKSKPTWCPGCPNFMILAGFKNFLNSEFSAGKKKDDFAIVSGIGCHAKIFDYVSLNGINTLHGRVLPTCLGMKIAKPELNVFGFSGDGDAYAEGMEHLIHAARYNSNINYVVHNNQVFALTVGEPTPTTEMGFKDKSNPRGVKTHPINPIRIMLAAGATFVARVFAEPKQVEFALREASKHKGFSFVEIIQPCLIFHPDVAFKEHIYSLEEEGHNKNDFDAAWKKAGEFDYNSVSRVPMGVFYESERDVFEESINKRQ